MQEIVYLIQNGADLEEAGQKSIEERYCFLELKRPGYPAEMDKLVERDSPRLIKTHMPYQMMANQVNRDKTKFIVVMRNPKDNLVSMYHFYRTNRGLGLYSGSWDQFFEEYVKADQIVTGDALEYNRHWWDNRDNENVFIITYEEMKKDLRFSVERVAKFLEKDLSSAQLDKITQATTFDAMKINPATNYSTYSSMDTKKGSFIRKGMVGDWKNHMNQEQSDYIDARVDKMLAGSGLTFEYTQD